MQRLDLPSGTVTFLFTDVEGSTQLLHKLGAEAYAEALTKHRRAIREASAAYGGVEVDTQGDALFVAFPTAPGALAAATQIQAMLEAGPIRVRAGLHTGTPLVTDEGYVGADVHRAARIAAAGCGGQLLVSASTAALVTGADLRDLGEHRFKDLAAPERVFQLGEGEFLPLRSLYRTNLPVPTTPFLGRDHELADVVALLAREDVRLLTLTGPGGTGKTRLALQAAAESADDFPDGVWWVPLAPLRDGSLVLTAVAQAIGVKEESERELAETLAARLGSAQTLLLLDNAEHLLPDVALTMSALVDACPTVKLLVTSREILQLRAEYEFALAAFAPEEGVAFLLSRAAAHGVDLADSDAVRELCRRLDSLPLALELASARMKLFSPEQLQERLGERLDLLRGGRDNDPRQRTLRATVEWSHDLLDEREQQLFRRMGVFVGGCTYDAAENVAEADADLLQSLLDKSLLRQREERSSERRYWMLETIRDFATERLGELGEVEGLRQSHAENFLRLAEESRRPLRGPEQRIWLRRLTLDEDNLRAALGWAIKGAHAEIALRLAHALEVFWIRAGRLTEAGLWLDRALELGAPAQPILRARALATGGIFASDPDTASARFGESIPVLRSSGDEEALAFALRGLAWLHKDGGKLQQARAALEESVELLEKLGHTLTTRLCDLGSVALEEGDLAGAHQWFERALAAAGSDGDDLGAAAAIDWLGEVALAAGDVDEAEKRYRDALRMHIAFDDFTGVDSMGGLAVAAARRGSFETAGWLWGAAEQLARNHDARLWPSLSDRGTSLEELAVNGRDAFERGRNLALRQPHEVILNRLHDLARSDLAPA